MTDKKNTPKNGGAKHKTPSKRQRQKLDSKPSTGRGYTMEDAVRLSEARERADDANKVTRQELEKRVSLPAPTTISYEEDSALYQEQLVTQVEQLMLKGINTNRAIMEVLPDFNPASDSDRHRLNRIKEKVHARWEIVVPTSKGANGTVRLRGMAVKQLEIMEMKLWQDMERFKQDGRLRVVIAKQLMELCDYKLKLHGIQADKIVDDTRGYSMDSEAFDWSNSQLDKLREMRRQIQAKIDNADDTNDGTVKH